MPLDDQISRIKHPHLKPFSGEYVSVPYLDRYSAFPNSRDIGVKVSSKCQFDWVQ